MVELALAALLQSPAYANARSARSLFERTLATLLPEDVQAAATRLRDVIATAGPARPGRWGSLPGMDDQATRRARRRAVAFMLVLVATAMVVVEPFPSGAVLVSLTRTHGVDVGDLPAVGVYLVAAVLALWPG